MIGLLMAAIMVAKPAAGRGDWIEPKDYPAAAYRARQSGRTGVDLTVDMTGRAIGCEVTEPSGHQQLDDQTCFLLLRRASFAPALDAIGKPVLGIHHVVSRWWLPGMPEVVRTEPAADVSLTVTKLPDGVENPARISLVVLVDAEGKVSECAPEPLGAWVKSDRDKKQRTIALLGNTACVQARALLQAQPARDVDGRTAASVRTVSVAFSTEIPPSAR